MAIGLQTAPEIVNETGFIVITPSTVTFAQVANLMVSVMEGGYSPWVVNMRPVHPDMVAVVTQGPWYSDAKFWAQPNVMVKVFEDENESGDEDDAKLHLIGHHAIAAGLAALAADTSYSHHFADIIGENDDAGTADIFMQFVVLGKEVYA